ncbi:ABC transporter ATP-binding protein [Pseudaminobacter soli (ex Li et al. 2025)]|uniref:Dipeptide/oligopeptide/nickel ABC transporter ATP-binding protein n=1 Tax=Pseudaminobacter soli (ex Li et al. 2025) TaxID=1295366 RepID=A0A2P7S534_9HYPH|nr:ABC transporter ATP-binding protein [Mesorhizobium soli]PSJ57578.1 dipeptide/oligopeptide/nickel ABC transporter ATP-binding protein [Mesorhizobium soli]
MTAEPILIVKDLTIDLLTAHTAVRPVDSISYQLRRGETLAIVGESGSGKTVTCFAPLGLMPVGVKADVSGSVLFEGTELVGANEETLRSLRGKSIGFIFQDPMSALNPARRIGHQIAEVAELHLGITPRAAEARALDLIKMVGMSDPNARLKQYPHELSGGLRQRVMIAISIAAEPKLLVADEPTTALDVTVQAQILRLLKEIQARMDMAMVLITHDMGVVAGAADRVLVMYAGRQAEVGPTEKVLVAPRHPYTMGLIDAIPRRDDAIGSRFRGLSGLPPILGAPIKGCAFTPRCRHSVEGCGAQRPPLRTTADPAVMAACPVLNA